ncbi:MAG: DHH family phosphoesterase [Desulfobacterales bacterium]|nr:DHH family phosphoesterase [Desulfobacterales bacterium]
MDNKTTITDKLMETVKGKRTAIILTHNNPDPDSIAGAIALKYILYKTKRIKSIIGYSGIIGRAENRTMVENLKIDMIPFSEIKFSKDKLVALIDSQPGAGNNSLPKKVKANIVIDHHAPLRVKTKEAAFCDVRVEYGSVSTILTEYISNLSLSFDKRTATSLYYGIKSDIDDLARNSIAADIKGLQLLFPHISMRLLTRIEHPKVPKEYFLKFVATINNALIFSDVIISDLKDVKNPDMVAEMSDFLMRMENIRWSLCLGSFDNQLIFSIRTTSRGKWASNIATRLLGNRGTGGGHHKSAAGKVDIANLSEKSIENLKQSIIKRFLKLTGREGVHAIRMV